MGRAFGWVPEGRSGARLRSTGLVLVHPPPLATGRAHQCASTQVARSLATECWPSLNPVQVWVGAAQPEPRSGTHRPNLVRGSGARVGGLRPGRGVRSALASPTGPYASLRDHPAPRTTFRTPCAPERPSGQAGFARPSANALASVRPGRSFAPPDRTDNLCYDGRGPLSHPFRKL